MPSNSKPRKKYRPKPVLLNPIDHVVQGVKPPAPDRVLKVQAINHGALHSLTRGKGTKADWDHVTWALNTALLLCELDVGAEYKDDVLAAMKAHNACGIRHVRGHNFGYTGPELMDVNRAMGMHDLQMPLVTVAEYESAQREVERRVMRGHISYSPKRSAHAPDKYPGQRRC